MKEPKDFHRLKISNAFIVVLTQVACIPAYKNRLYTVKRWNSQKVRKVKASTVNTNQDKNKDRQPVRKWLQHCRNTIKDWRATRHGVMRYLLAITSITEIIIFIIYRSTSNSTMASIPKRIERIKRLVPNQRRTRKYSLPVLHTAFFGVLT